MNSVNNWLHSLGKELKVDTELEDGFCHLLIDEELAVSIECHEGDEHLYLSAEIGQLPEGGSPEEGFLLLQRAMELNAFQESTDGGAIGLAVGEPILIYCRRIELATSDEKSLAQGFANFYATAHVLRQSLELAPFPMEEPE